MEMGLSFVISDRGGITLLEVVVVGLRLASRTLSPFFFCTFLPAARILLSVLCVLPGME